MKVECADLKSCAHGSGRKGSTPLATILNIDNNLLLLFNKIKKAGTT